MVLLGFTLQLLDLPGPAGDLKLLLSDPALGPFANRTRRLPHLAFNRQIALWLGVLQFAQLGTRVLVARQLDTKMPVTMSRMVSNMESLPLIFLMSVGDQPPFISW